MDERSLAAVTHQLARARGDGADDEVTALCLRRRMAARWGKPMPPERMIMGLPHRFWMKAVIDDRGYETPCLTWTASTNQDGYGRFRWQGRKCQAHRVAYEVLVAEIPAGLTIDHLCRNVACVNASHMEPVTNRVNTLRSGNPAAINAAKTHCRRRNHEYTPENTITDRSGKRKCRACSTILDRERRRQRAEARSRE
jgi:hypothetical protein